MKSNNAIHGFESPCKEYVKPTLSLDDLLVPHGGDIYIVEMDSEDLIYVGIHKHDLLVVDTSLTAHDNDIIICSLNGDYMCCIFNRKARTISYAAHTVSISEEHDFRVLGVVSSSIRAHHPVTISSQNE